MIERISVQKSRVEQDRTTHLIIGKTKTRKYVGNNESNSVSDSADGGGGDNGSGTDILRTSSQFDLF